MPSHEQRAFVQFLEQVEQLWEWRYRRRLAELRGTHSDDWNGGHHVPSLLWGGIVMCCWFYNDLWLLEPNPQQIRREAEAAAYARFMKEVLDEGKSTTDRSGHEP